MAAIENTQRVASILQSDRRSTKTQGCIREAMELCDTKLANQVTLKLLSLCFLLLGLRINTYRIWQREPQVYPPLIKSRGAGFPLLLRSVPNGSENISLATSWKIFDNFIHVIFLLFYSVFTFICIFAGAKSLMFSLLTAQRSFLSTKKSQAFIRLKFWKQ